MNRIRSYLIQTGKVDSDGEMFSKDCKFQFPKHCPIFWDFDLRRSLGMVDSFEIDKEKDCLFTATVNSIGKDLIDKFPNVLSFAPAGFVVKRGGKDNKEIYEFHLKSVSIVKNSSNVLTGITKLEWDKE